MSGWASYSYEYYYIHYPIMDRSDHFLLSDTLPNINMRLRTLNCAFDGAWVIKKPTDLKQETSKSLPIKREIKGRKKVRRKRCSGDFQAILKEFAKQQYFAWCIKKSSSIFLHSHIFFEGINLWISCSFITTSWCWTILMSIT